MMYPDDTMYEKLDTMIQLLTDLNVLLSTLTLEFCGEKKKRRN